MFCLLLVVCVSSWFEVELVSTCIPQVALEHFCRRTEIVSAEEAHWTSWDRPSLKNTEFEHDHTKKDLLMLFNKNAVSHWYTSPRLQATVVTTRGPSQILPCGRPVKTDNFGLDILPVYHSEQNCPDGGGAGRADVVCHNASATDTDRKWFDSHHSVIILLQHKFVVNTVVKKNKSIPSSLTNMSIVWEFRMVEATYAVRCSPVGRVWDRKLRRTPTSAEMIVGSYTTSVGPESHVRRNNSLRNKITTKRSPNQIGSARHVDGDKTDLLPPQHLHHWTVLALPLRQFSPNPANTDARDYQFVVAARWTLRCCPHSSNVFHKHHWSSFWKGLRNWCTFHRVCHQPYVVNCLMIVHKCTDGSWGQC